MKTSFWTYFTSGYGIIWLAMLFVGLVTQTHLNAGWFGLIGFPIIALVYAFIRRTLDVTAIDPDSEYKAIKGDPMYQDFLGEDKSRLHLYKEDLVVEFRAWKNKLT